MCVATNCKITIPKSIDFTIGEFVWESDRLCSVHQKASYLYTGYLSNNRESDFDKIDDILEKNNIEIIKEKPKYSSYGGLEDGYVDHSDQLGEFLNAMLIEENLLNFLFSPLSYVINGNDNSNDDVSIYVKYEHDEYFKGN